MGRVGKGSQGHMDMWCGWFGRSGLEGTGMGTGGEQEQGQEPVLMVDY